MRNYLIAKPSNDIHIVNREDRTKTDLQSQEILAFIKAINYTLQSTYPSHQHSHKISLLNSFATSMTNNINLSNDKEYKSIYSNVHQQLWESKTAIDEIHNYNSSDIFFIFCGLWDKNNQQNQAIIEFAKVFKGSVYYVQNDLRLDMPEELKPYIKLTLTQATKNNSVNNRAYMALDFLPMFYVNQQLQYPHKYDVVVPFLNWKDNGEYRRNKMLNLINYNDRNLKRLFVGDYQNIDEIHVHGSLLRKEGCEYHPPMKHNELATLVRQSKSSYVISEQVYIDNGLMPNRVMEALLSGVLPLIDENTLDSFGKDAKDMICEYLYFAPNDWYDFETRVNKKALYEISQFSAKLHTSSDIRSRIFRYITDNFIQFIL